MTITKTLTLEEIVAEETGDLHVRILKLRTVIEQQKEKIAALEADLAKRPEAPA